MTDIKCDVILAPEDVNQYLLDHGYAIEHGPVAVGDGERGEVERNGLTAICLGRNRGGIATVILCHEMYVGPRTEERKVTRIVHTSLALLEHVVGTMREALGEDERIEEDHRG